MKYPPQSIKITPVGSGLWDATITCLTYADAERLTAPANKELQDELERLKPREWDVLVSCDGSAIESPRSDVKHQWFCKTIRVKEVK